MRELSVCARVFEHLEHFCERRLMNGCMLERDGHCLPAPANEDTLVAACSGGRVVGTDPCSSMKLYRFFIIAVNSQKSGGMDPGQRLDPCIENQQEFDRLHVKAQAQVTWTIAQT
jgi:hypothetical protein